MDEDFEKKEETWKSLLNTVITDNGRIACDFLSQLVIKDEHYVKCPENKMLLGLARIALDGNDPVLYMKSLFPQIVFGNDADELFDELNHI